MLALAEEDAGQQIWISAHCLGQAQLEMAGTAASMRDLLDSPDRGIRVAVLDGPAGRRVAR